MKEKNEGQVQTESEKEEAVHSENCAQNESSDNAEGQCTNCNENAEGADGAVSESEGKDTPKTSEERIAELEAEIEGLKTQALYKAAETDNWRKNMLKQKEDAVSYANESLLRDLLDSLDNFDRTVEASATATDVKSIADGVRMISKSLSSLLENKYNLVPFGKEGDDFDPELHEAIGSQEGDVEKEQLKQVYLKGYKLKDRVIRHAKVMVEKPKSN